MGRIIFPDLEIGTQLLLKTPDPSGVFPVGTLFQILDNLPEVYVVRPIGPNAGKDITVSRTQVWSWFKPLIEFPEWENSMSGERDQREMCVHTFVNVSFNGIEMACKHCGIGEKNQGPSYAAGTTEINMNSIHVGDNPYQELEKCLYMLFSLQ